VNNSKNWLLYIRKESTGLVQADIQAINPRPAFQKMANWQFLGLCTFLYLTHFIPPGAILFSFQI